MRASSYRASYRYAGCSGQEASCGRRVDQSRARAACAARMPITARRVVQLTAQHGVVGLVEVDPARGHAQLLALAGEPVAVRHVGEVARHEDPQRLAHPAGRGVVVHQDVPAAGLEVGLLVQLTRCRLPRGLTGDVQQARRQLPLERADRMAVLLDEEHAATVVQGHDPHGAGVLDVLATDRPALTEVDGVAHDIPDHSLEDRLAVLDRTLLQPVHQLLAARGRRPQRHGADTVSAGAWRSTSTSREARWASIAAPTRPANSGCARCGRDRNSGCAWVET